MEDAEFLAQLNFGICTAWAVMGGLEGDEVTESLVAIVGVVVGVMVVS